MGPQQVTSGFDQIWSTICCSTWFGDLGLWAHSLQHCRWIGRWLRYRFKPMRLAVGHLDNVRFRGDKACCSGIRELIPPFPAMLQPAQNGSMLLRSTYDVAASKAKYANDDITTGTVAHQCVLSFAGAFHQPSSADFQHRPNQRYCQGFPHRRRGRGNTSKA